MRAIDGPRSRIAEVLSSKPWPLLGLGLLVAATYGVTLAGDFVYDDRFIIADNSLIRDPGLWGRFFTQGSWAGAGIEAHTYRPLPLLSFGLNYLAGGLQPLGYHLVNLAVHLLAVALLFRLATQIGWSPGGGWVAAALFAVHPLQAEPVAAVVGRMDLMAGAAFLGALLLHVEARHRAAAGRPQGWAVAGALGLYAVALLSKEHVILLPLVALLYDRLYLRCRGPRDAAVYLGYAAIAGLYLVTRAAVFDGELLAGAVALVDNPLAHAPPTLRVLSAMRVAGLYLSRVIVPVGLSPDYCYAQILPFAKPDSAAALLTLGAGLVLVAAGVLAGRRSRRVALALAIAAGTFLPVSNLLFAIGTVMGDRLFYLPLAGLALLAGLLFAEARRRYGASLPMVLAGLAIGGLAVVGFVQARQWRDQFALDRLTVRAAPGCTSGHSNLGYDYLGVGDLDRAEESFRRSLAIYPDFDAAVAGLATAAMRRGRVEEARRLAERALALNPAAGAMLELSAEAARQGGDLAAARRYWRRRLELDPQHAASLSNLAILTWQEGATASALELWKRATRQPEAPAETWFNLARAYDSLGRSAAAATAYERYLSLAPEDSRLRAVARQRLEALRPP